MKPKNPEIELKACWSKREKDIMIYYPSAPDGHFMNSLLNGLTLTSMSKSTANREIENGVNLKFWCDSYNKYMGVYSTDTFLEALDKRGYDLTTLKISIKKKKK